MRKLLQAVTLTLTHRLFPLHGLSRCIAPLSENISLKQGQTYPKIHLNTHSSFCYSHSFSSGKMEYLER